MEPVQVYRRLIKDLRPLEFAAPVHTVYNPLEYAWKPFERYLELYGKGPKEFLLLGMNPGPWGMAQTGIPFGEVSIARDWLKVGAPVGQPEKPHPKRPIEGFDCMRSEVSGARLWGWARARFGAPEKFFARFFILNYCPLAFMEESGKNLTPDKLPKAERAPLEAACDKALRDVVAALAPKVVVGVGGFARKRAELALGGMGLSFEELLHPSPANPQANRGWDAHADALLKRLAI